MIGEGGRYCVGNNEKGTLRLLEYKEELQERVAAMDISSTEKGEEAVGMLTVKKSKRTNYKPY